MAKYQLVYFNTKGKAEVCRFLFAQAGVDYEDKRVTKEEWVDLKSDTPTGQLPMLVVDGKLKLPQSMAIARLLAKEFAMYGADNIEAAQIDALCDYVNELIDAAVLVLHAPDDTVKAKMMEKYETKAEAVLKILDNALAGNKSGWLVGDKVSMADFLCCTILDVLTSGFPGFGGFEASVKAHIRITAHTEKVNSLPRIKEWITKRPVTEH